MNERNEFIARMEASEIAPTWETIYDLNVTLAALRADLATAEREQDRLRKAAAASADRVHTWILEDTCDRLRKTAAAQNHEIEQILGAALGYPRYCDDQKNFPGATEADGVCVGYHVAETLATEAAARIEKYRAALIDYSTHGQWRLRYNELREWIGEGEGPDLALRALGDAKIAEVSHG